MRLLPVGRRAVLVEVEDAGQALSLATWARARVDAEEVVPAARTVLFDGLAPAAAAGLDAVLDGWRPTEPAPGAHLTLDVEWDGPDLGFVADHWGTDPVRVLRETAFTVAFCGFAPGFAYLAGLPPGATVPRLDSPRPAVPAGSVGLAGEYAGVYPSRSPGGWRLVGRTDAVLWDPAREPPALLPPGTRVRLR